MIFDKGHALLVGVGTYANPQFSAPVTAQDAQDLAAVLGDPQRAGYPATQVQLLSGPAASRPGVLAALADLAAQTDATSTVLLFLCGHGMPDPAGGYFFLPYEARWGPGGRLDPASVISSNELVAAVRAIPAQKVLVLFNTCFSGTMTADLDATGTTVADPLGTAAPSDAVLAQVLGAGEGRVVISACRSNQRSAYNPAFTGANTLFVAKLLAGLRGEGVPARGGAIGVFELYEYLYEQVHGTIPNMRPGTAFTVAADGSRTLLSEWDQEPVITIRQGIGPFPVALYRGGAAGDLGVPDPPALKARPTVGAVTEVPAVQAGRDANMASQGGVANSGTMGAVQTGSGTQWNIGSIAAGRDSYIGSTVHQTQHGGVHFGNNAQVTGPVIGGDVHGTMFTGTFAGPVAGGDITQGAAELARVFAGALAAAQQLPPDDRELVVPVVKQAQAQAQKIQQGDAGPETAGTLEKRLKALANMAPDIAEVIFATLSSPAAGLAAVFGKIVQRAREGTTP
ncbi:MAG TPA: caspase family protein [Chloroflexia bacterium]|nr:caspase family protein [Chloroflexia bacterium]